VSRPPLALCFGVHNHQPIGNFDSVVVEATERAYRPFLERVRARPEVRLTVHCTGSLLEWLRERSPTTFDALGAVVAAGQVELLTGGFYEPILAVLPDPDKRGQIERLSEYLRAHFGVRPRGMWLAERVWEPHLPRALREAGVEYVLVDDSHFALAGLDPEALGGYYLTEEQGHTLAVFPISQRLRYLIPFAEPGKTLEYLEARRERHASVTIVDDGEKFGAWPGTFEHVYRDGWLDAFFDRLLDTPWLTLATFGDVISGAEASGRVYLPTASYREMGEWVLPVEAGEALETAKRDLGALDGGDRLVAMLRGGFWRGFLVKYPEIGDVYWKMTRLSAAVTRASRARPDDSRLPAAREALWRGQANDAYWHGVFGGCYLPHLRRAVKSALLECERALDAAGFASPACDVGDRNGDGRPEILLRTPALAVTLNPSQGGTLTEIGYLPRALDLADVLGRRPETYHARVRARRDAAATSGAHTIHDAPASKEAGLETLLAYDTFRRASLLDGWFPADGEIDPVEPWPAARVALGATALPYRVEPADREPSPSVVFTLSGDGFAGDKRVSVRGATIDARYSIEPSEPRAPAGRWAVQWNLALTAGDAPDRYLTLPGRPSLGSSGRAREVTSVALVDEWARVEARLAWTDGAELAWGPVQTVSVSESGFERIHQGTALLLTWPVADAAELAVSLTVGSR
jgi:4-alpha-glucanotransferase